MRGTRPQYYNLASVDYSDNTPSDSFTYSRDGNLIATSNSKAASVFENTALGIATNETQTVAQHTTSLERGLDAYSRQTSLSVSGEPTQSISYNAENQFSGT